MWILIDISIEEKNEVKMRWFLCIIYFLCDNEMVLNWNICYNGGCGIWWDCVICRRS